MSSSNFKILANRENAKHSTGPRTSAGKQRSSLNAITHGLTGQVVVLPEEDMKRYQAFCHEYMVEWQPQGPTEKNLVQTLADQQWRLHRAHARERGIYAIGFDKFGESVDTENPQVHALFTAALVDLEHSAQLERFSRYASRIQRDYHNTLKELKTLQTERKEHEKFEQPVASDIQKLMQMQQIPWSPSDDGFVVSKAQIDRYQQRERRKHGAYIAKNADFNKDKYLAAGGKLEIPS